MDVQQIKRKIKAGQPVSSEEDQAYMDALEVELRALKASEPDMYRQLLKNIADTARSITNDLRDVSVELSK